ncbi:hypothetical protein [Spongiactinospora sp. TRM90649]|uniref:hypothetical protein n=1 Tax=Spongiactinospora sp. TRM90649 TaxID=3031114 RepID=UPI0023F61F64|nr:hypothetical protein [Spongiactinospora sp. TRM90649]MDF5758002.1 hypothetical protein [Spongiactinospora sp. TRM90649]
MSLESWELDGDHYCLHATYVNSDAAWFFELSEARGGGVMPGAAAVTVVAHDAEIGRLPYVFFDGSQELPFEVLSEFVTRVTRSLRDVDGSGHGT